MCELMLWMPGKASDCVNHRKLFSMLLDQGVPLKYQVDRLIVTGMVRLCVLLPPAKRMVLLSVALVNLCVCLSVLFVL